MTSVEKNAKIAVVVLTLLFLAGMPTICSQSDTTTYMVFDEGVAFKLPTYGTVIRFSDDYQLTKFEWDNLNATTIYFYNLRMGDGDEISKMGFSVEGANLTVTKLFEGQYMVMELEGRSDVDSLTKLYIEDYDKPLFIKRNDFGTFLFEVLSLSELENTTNCWYYDSENKTLYIKVRHYITGPVGIEVSWQPAEEIAEEITVPIEYLIIAIIIVLIIIGLMVAAFRSLRQTITDLREKYRKFVKKKQFF